jgi:aryl sulfotransferase
MTSATSTGPHTVWLASYPKSGNTWARAVLATLTRFDRAAADPDGPASRRPGPGGLDLDINALDGGPIASHRWCLDSRLGFASSDLLQDEIDTIRPLCDAALDAELARVRFRKIHDALFAPATRTPIVPPAATRAAVYLVRDPRDVAVSFAHFNGRGAAWAVERMADAGGGLLYPADHRPPAAQVRQRLGTWSGHVDEWTGQALFPVAVFRYEDLHADPVGEFGRMATFAGLDVGPDQVAAAVEAARFERLQQQERERGFRERQSATKVFFRRGIVGSWRDELPPELARRIEADHRSTMIRHGYLTDPPVG